MRTVFFKYLYRTSSSHSVFTVPMILWGWSSSPMPKVLKCEMNIHEKFYSFIRLYGCRSNRMQIVIITDVKLMLKDAEKALCSKVGNVICFFFLSSG